MFATVVLAYMPEPPTVHFCVQTGTGIVPHPAGAKIVALVVLRGTADGDVNGVSVDCG